MTGNGRKRNQASGIVRSMRMLRNTHSPEYDSIFCSRKGSRNLSKCFCINTTNFRHGFWCKLLDMLLQICKALGKLFNIILVVQTFRNNHMKQRVQQCNICTRFELKHISCMSCQCRTPWVHHNQRLALLGRLFKIRRGNRMIFSRIRANDNDHISIFTSGERRSYCAGTNSFQQGGN